MQTTWVGLPAPAPRERGVAGAPIHQRWHPILFQRLRLQLQPRHQALLQRLRSETGQRIRGGSTSRTSALDPRVAGMDDEVLLQRTTHSYNLHDHLLGSKRHLPETVCAIRSATISRTCEFAIPNAWIPFQELGFSSTRLFSLPKSSLLFLTLFILNSAPNNC